MASKNLQARSVAPSNKTGSHLTAGDQHPAGSSVASSRRSRAMTGQIIRWESALQGGADADETLRGRDRSRRSIFKKMFDMDLKKSDGRLRQKAYILGLTAIPFILMMVRNAYMLSYNTSRIDGLTRNFNIMVDKMEYVKILLDVVMARADVLMYAADSTGYRSLNEIVNITTTALVRAEQVANLQVDEDKIRKQLISKDGLFQPWNICL